ncbi:hypothetical protein N7541_008539 [Penicillium brevicompactum]|uniref:Uncharacterized protein n=1 Tax=Penicillium brevicompactum TaxID=5074 RepID=A0A9W9QZ69_PENBR|nr:hypothetical protein N7541_008539 [Penicillium brevicompactum]
MSSEYAAALSSPSRPTALQIVESDRLREKLTSKVIFITGCSSGLGVQTALALYETGATLYLTARDTGKARAALKDIIDSPRVQLSHLDLSSLASVRACANEFKAASSTLHILIENAGVMACPEGRTIDGFETQLGVNHLAHFLLFHLLKPVLLASSTPKFNSRVVILSSVAHQYSDVKFSNINLEGEYDSWKAYGQSKTANLWTANEIERRHGPSGLHAFSVHPGGILTDLQRHVPEEQKATWAKDAESSNYWKSPEQGAATTVWAAVSAELEGQGGKYLEDCSIAGPADSSQGKGYATWAYNSDAEAKMYAKTMEMLDLREE